MNFHSDWDQSCLLAMSLSSHVLPVVCLFLLTQYTLRHAVWVCVWMGECGLYCKSAFSGEVDQRATYKHSPFTMTIFLKKTFNALWYIIILEKDFVITRPTVKWWNGKTVQYFNVHLFISCTGDYCILLSSFTWLQPHLINDCQNLFSLGSHVYVFHWTCTKLKFQHLHLLAK